MRSPITDLHAIRIAKRLARHARRDDRFLTPGIRRRLWALLDAHDLARAAYNRPPDKMLVEHAATLTPDEHDQAVECLIEATMGDVTTSEAP